MVVILTRQHDEYADRVQRFLTLCLTAGVEVVVTPHLYYVAEDDPLWEELAALPEPVTLVCRLHPRPAEWLLRRHGIFARALDLGAFPSAEECFAALERHGKKNGTHRELPAETTERWYPVVDGDRCVHCRHCLQFCLFGVYTEEDGQVVVRNPDLCKPGCPACSRICPHGAIIFPLYEKDDAIAGAPGKYMEPDLPARKMYYTRTKFPCPLCGLMESTPDASGPLCPECGRPSEPPAPPRPASCMMRLMR